MEENRFIKSTILSLRAQRGNLTFKVVPIDTVNVNYLIYISSERLGA